MVEFCVHQGGGPKLKYHDEDSIFLRRISFAEFHSANHRRGHAHPRSCLGDRLIAMLGCSLSLSKTCTRFFKGVSFYLVIVLLFGFAILLGSKQASSSSGSGKRFAARVCDIGFYRLERNAHIYICVIYWLLSLEYCLLSVKCVLTLLTVNFNRSAA